MRNIVFIVFMITADPRIAFELALSTMRPIQKELVPRSQCEVCNGTGKVTAGDTLVIVERECDNCFDDSQGEEKPEALQLKEKYWQIHITDNCVYCDILKAHVKTLKKAGWADNKFKFIKGGANSYPTSRLIYDGKILESWKGAGNPNFWANRYKYWRTPTEWRAECKEYSGQMWEVTGSDVKSHLLQDHGQKSWQIEGLTENELNTIHSILHENPQ